jgi:hypothetical protein
MGPGNNIAGLGATQQQPLPLSPVPLTTPTTTPVAPLLDEMIEVVVFVDSLEPTLEVYPESSVVNVLYEKYRAATVRVNDKIVGRRIPLETMQEYHVTLQGVSRQPSFLPELN